MYSKPADVKQPYSAFPSDFVSKEEKLSPDYGLKYVKAIWTNYTINYPANNPQVLRHIKSRQYSEGLQPTAPYRNRLGLEGDTSYLNLDYNSIDRIPTIIDNMVGMAVNRYWKLECNPTDAVAKSRYDQYRRELETNRFLKKLSDQLEPVTGMPLVPKDQFIPEDDEEMDLHMQMNFKLDESVAMEMALKWVLDNNNFTSESVPQIFRDLFETKKTAIFRSYDENRNIKVTRWDHLKLITPFSDRPDFSNIPYQALIHTYTIGQIAKMNTGFTDEQLYTIAKNNAGKNNNVIWNTQWGDNYEGYYSNWGANAYNQFQNFNIMVLNFYFLTPITTTSAVKISSKGRVKVERKKDGYKSDKGVDVIKKKKLYRMEGFWVPDTEYIWGYKMSENIDREIVEGAYSPECELPCKIIAPNMRDMTNKSVVERMIPLQDQLVLAWLKLQQFLIEAMPPGMAINQNALLDIVQGMGEGKAKPRDWTKLYKQTGSFVFNDRDENGQPINIPFKELVGGISPAFEQFIRVQDYCIAKMNEVVGFNTAVDASSPTKDNGLGLNQMAQRATYNCLRPIYIAATNLIEGTGKRLSLMIQDSIRHNNRAFLDAIGEANVSAITMGRDLPFSSAAITITLQPDESEQMEIQGWINLGIEKGTLTSAQALMVRQQLKTDTKLAGRLLAYYEGKNLKDKQAQAMQLQQQNGQIQIQSAQAASESQAQLSNLETANEIAKIEAKKKADLELIAAETQRELIVQDRKNLGSWTAAEIQANAKIGVQEASNRGKAVAQTIANEGKLLDTHLQNSSDHAYQDKEHHHEKEIGPKTPVKS